MKYLANSPASLSNVDLSINFKCNFTGCLKSVLIIGSRNKVVYSKDNDAQTMLVDLHRETFDEAERIVNMRG